MIGLHTGSIGSAPVSPFRSDTSPSHLTHLPAILPPCARRLFAHTHSNVPPGSPRRRPGSSIKLKSPLAPPPRFNRGPQRFEIFSPRTVQSRSRTIKPHARHAAAPCTQPPAPRTMQPSRVPLLVTCYLLLVTPQEPARD